MNYACIYSDPVYFRPEKPEDGLAFSKSTCVAIPDEAPELPIISSTFSEGEIIISLFLFGIFLILFTNLIYNQFVGTKLKAQM